MNMLTLLVVVAVVATIVSLASGISSMAFNGEVGHRTSAQWMIWRVVFQAAAFVLILLTMLAPS
jgi:hypothetical protein